MIPEILIEKTFEKFFDVAKDVVKKILKERRSKLAATRDDLEESLNLYLRAIKNWSDEISFSDLKRAKRTTDVFIELDLYVYPRRVRIDPSEVIESIPLKDIFDGSSRHFILLGQPGAGKTTSMKYLCQLARFSSLH